MASANSPATSLSSEFPPPPPPLSEREEDEETGLLRREDIQQQQHGQPGRINSMSILRGGVVSEGEIYAGSSATFVTHESGNHRVGGDNGKTDSGSCGDDCGGDTRNEDVNTTAVATPTQDNENGIVRDDGSALNQIRGLEEEFGVGAEKSNAIINNSKKDIRGMTDRTSSSDNCEQQQPKRRGNIAERIKDAITGIDMFAFDPSGEDYVKPHQSLIGALGTIATVVLFAIVIVDSLRRFSIDETERNTKNLARVDEDSSEIGELGLLLYHGGKPFYDERFFRIGYMYRAIYSGDSENDVRPRVYLDIPSTTCLLYDDDNSPGKNATLGCPDMDAARRILAAEKQRMISEAEAKTNAGSVTQQLHDDIANFPVVPIVKGSYGSDAYWFLEAKLLGCASYGDAENITCANSTEIRDKFMEHSFNFDFVMSSQISRTEHLWKNLYMEIEMDRWTGVETYFKKTYSFETDRFLHKTTKNHLNYNSFDSFAFRTNRRLESEEDYYSFYIRLSGEVVEEKLVHYSFLDTLTDIGGAWEVVLIFMTVGFVGFNYISYKQKLKKIEREKLNKSK